MGHVCTLTTDSINNALLSATDLATHPRFHHRVKFSPSFSYTDTKLNKRIIFICDSGKAQPSTTIGNIPIIVSLLKLQSTTTDLFG
jgi:hypothetical protein